MAGIENNNSSTLGEEEEWEVVDSSWSASPDRQSHGESLDASVISLDSRLGSVTADEDEDDRNTISSRKETLATMMAMEAEDVSSFADLRAARRETPEVQNAFFPGASTDSETPEPQQAVFDRASRDNEIYELQLSIYSMYSSLLLDHSNDQPDAVELDNVEGGFDSEFTVKARRAQDFHNPNRCHGKTRRRKCHCPSCRDRCTGKLSHEGHRYVNHSLSDHVGTETVRYPVTEFDLLGLRMSPNKSENWKMLREALEETASSKRVIKAQYDVRRVEVYDVEIVGSMVTPQTQYRYDERMALRESRADIRAWKTLKQNTYYILKNQLRVQQHDAKDTSIFQSSVQALPMAAPAVVHTDEEYIHARPVFFSRLTKRSPRTTLLTSASMISSTLVHEELATLTRNRWYSFGPSILQSHSNHDRCWASEPTDDPMYEDWHLELDFACDRQITAIVLQGQAPVLEEFPSPLLFSSSQEAVKYRGPKWPTIRSGHQGHWVERVEIRVRSTHSDWISLGTFRANDDMLTEVRIDLPLPYGHRIRGMRIQPLAKAKGGYHGDAPAMRCGVIALKEHTKRRAAEVANPSRIPDGFVRYKLWMPDPSAAGVQEGAAFVAGKAIESCAVHNKYTRGSWNDKTQGIRYQKKKAMRAMLLDSDTYDS